MYNTQGVIASMCPSGRPHWLVLQACAVCVQITSTPRHVYLSHVHRSWSSVETHMHSGEAGFYKAIIKKQNKLIPL